MKLTNTLLAALFSGLSLVPGGLSASRLTETNLPADLAWFVHLDADLLRNSRSGGALFRELRKIDYSGENQQLPIDPLLVLNGIRGITVFGPMPDFANGGKDLDGVVLLDGTPELIQIFRGMIAGMELEKPDSLSVLETEPYRILGAAEGGAYGAFVDETSIAIGKSLPALKNYLNLQQGRGQSLDLATRFPGYARGSQEFFFGAFVEGLQNFDQLPVQARILKLTQAVSVQLGENEDQLGLQASLVTEDSQTARQVYDVLQGIVAMFSLTQTGQPDVAALVQSARVNLDERTVALQLRYPAAQMEKWASLLAEQIVEGIKESQSAPEASGGEGESPEEEPAPESAP